MTACQTTTFIPAAYNFKAKEVKNNPYGCWTILEHKADSGLLQTETVSGELLFMDADTLFLLVSDSYVYPIFSQYILKAELYTHKNMAGNYITTAGILLIPSVVGALVHTSQYGGAFLVLGIPVTVIGLVNSIVEGSGKRNVLVYPEKNSIENLARFARFPAGRPLSVDLHQLKLKPDPVSLKKPKK
ncbi:MAG: hypothetical protein H7X84_01085 [Verrucomicrobia bacterium]|nr:hypothetical protein [Prolixibacteraceae bacterium]